MDLRIEKLLSYGLLQRKKDENLALPGRERLERFANQRAGSVHFYSGDLHRPRFHCETRLVARNEEIADFDGASGRVHLYANTACRGDLRLVLGCYTQRDPRLIRHHTSDFRVVSA